MWPGTVNFIFYTWQNNVKGQLILILKSAASRPVASFHEVKEIISESILKTALIIFSVRSNQKDIIRVCYECTVRTDYFSFLIVPSGIIESAGRCAHGEKLYYVQWLITQRCLILLRLPARWCPASQREKRNTSRSSARRSPDSPYSLCVALTVGPRQRMLLCVTTSEAVLMWHTRSDWLHIRANL